MFTVKQEYGILKSEFRDWSSGDPWGDAMHWHFTVADELHYREGLTPDHWQYRPSPLGPVNDLDDHATQTVTEVRADTLVGFGNLLYRYCRMLKHLGLDY